MSNNRRNWKFFVAYAAFREFRYNAHRRQNEKAREARLHPQPSIPFAYWQWVFFLVVMGLLSLLWFVLFNTLALFLFMGVIWDVCVAVIFLLGCRETYRRLHG